MPDSPLSPEEQDWIAHHRYTRMPPKREERMSDRADEIARLRQKAYDTWCDMRHLSDEAQIDILLAALRDFAKEERERCAKIVETELRCAPALQKMIAARIREGGEPKE